jgi:hypothetical protein
VRRLVAVGAVAALTAAAAVPLLPRAGSASTICPQPSVNEIDVGTVPQQHGALNSSVTLKGSGFSAFSCNLSVNINGVGVGNLQAPSSQQITFTLSTATSGMLNVSLTDSTNSSNTDNHLVFITDPSGASLSTTTPTTGSTVQFNGANFDFHLPSNLPVETYTAGYSWSGGGACPGSPSATPTLKSSTQFTIAMPSQYCDGSASVTLSAPCGSNNAVCSGTANTRMSFTVSAPFDIAAKVSSAPTSGVAGQSASISGSGFGSSSGPVTFNGTTAPVSSWKDTAIGFTIPANATSGNLQVIRPYDGATVYQGSFGVSASIGGLSTPKAAVGDAVTINGTGFGPQQGSSGGVTINSTQATITSWSATSIGFTVPAGATTGPVVVTTSGTTSPSSTPSLTVIPKITSFNPTHAAPGALVAIDGTTFGTQQGTVTIGGQAAQVTLWGDQEVLAVIPSGLTPGSTNVTLSPPGSDAASAPFSIDAPAATPAPGGTSSNSSSSSSSHGSVASATPGFIAPNPSGPVIAHGPVAFFKPSPPPGPVSLRLDSAANQADPGSGVKFTVTLTAFGKPIAGAPVDLLMVIEPGADASIDPTHAVTDASGKVQGVIHLSKTPGDHIVLARSGIYSDEIRVVSRSATNTVATARQGGGGANPAATPPLLAVRSPVLWALVSCLLLFGVGFGLNLVTSPAVAGAAAVDERRRARGESVVGPVATLGSALRFAAGVVAVLGASVLGRLRGPQS